MRTYTLIEAQNRHEEIFDKAALEPVLLTKQSQPSHVVMSVDTYKLLIERLTQLEDMALGKAAEAALNHSQIVGTETFAETLKQSIAPF
jgi:prevent-host-death family protein